MIQLNIWELLSEKDKCFSCKKYYNPENLFKCYGCNFIDELVCSKCLWSKEKFSHKWMFNHIARQTDKRMQSIIIDKHKKKHY